VFESLGASSACSSQNLLQDPAGDPGYMSTTRMLLECALCLVLQADDLEKDPYASQNPGGVLTPSSAFGLVVHDRLRAIGFEISVSDSAITSTSDGAVASTSDEAVAK
jgi:short subunit dehydrogenase-like uncharacterized protein